MAPGLAGVLVFAALSSKVNSSVNDVLERIAADGTTWRNKSAPHGPLSWMLWAAGFCSRWPRPPLAVGTQRQPLRHQCRLNDLDDERPRRVLAFGNHLDRVHEWTQHSRFGQIRQPFGQGTFVGVKIGKKTPSVAKTRPTNSMALQRLG
jgi:hypothetical protein